LQAPVLLLSSLALVGKAWLQRTLCFAPELLLQRFSKRPLQRFSKPLLQRFSKP